MPTNLIPQTPDPEPDSYATGLASFGPSSRAVARAARRHADAVPRRGAAAPPPDPHATLSSAGPR